MALFLVGRGGDRLLCGLEVGVDIIVVVGL